jgi:hypothetical protein
MSPWENTKYAALRRVRLRIVVGGGTWTGKEVWRVLKLEEAAQEWPLGAKFTAWHKG